MDRKTAERVVRDLEEAIAPVLKKHGLVLEEKSARYGSTLDWTVRLQRWRQEMVSEARRNATRRELERRRGA